MLFYLKGTVMGRQVEREGLREGGRKEETDRNALHLLA